MPRKDHFAALDVGSSTIAALVASVEADGRLTVRGVGVRAAAGIRRGFVAQVDDASASIRTALHEAARTSGLKIDAVYVALSGAHAEGINSRAAVTVTGPDGAVTRDDLHRAMEAATAMRVPAGCEILQIVPQRFHLDDQDGIADPIGMRGVRLEAQLHVITARTSPLHNLLACVRRAGVSVRDVIAEPFADSHAVVTGDEKELGVALVNIGGGTTTMAIFDRGMLIHTAAIEIGGEHFTNDLAVALRTPVREAEALKCRSGCALAGLVDDDETVAVASIGRRPSRTLPRAVVADALQPRAEEIFHAVAREIRSVGCENHLNAGIVLTGGGALLPGIDAVAELMLAVPVRRGIPEGLGGLMDHIGAPGFATVAGTLSYAHLMNAHVSRVRLSSFISLLGL